MTETAADALAHEALLYRDDEELLTAALRFVRDGLAQDAPTLVALSGSRLALLRQALGDDAGRVRECDMDALGANPSRILPVVIAFADETPDRRVRILGESSRPARAAHEIAEVARHEACVTLALAGRPVDVLCTFAASSVPQVVLDDAERTHTHLIAGDERRASTAYADPLEVWAAADRPLAGPTAPLASLMVDGDVGDVRRTVRAVAEEAGLGPDAINELLVATSEAVANSLLHAAPPVTVTMWLDGGDLVTDVDDRGRVTDPLVGRRRPGLEATHGRGLYLVNHLCDLVELRSGEDGTTVRLRMDRTR